MRKGKFNIHFFIRNPDKEGKAPVYLRLTYLRKKADISINEFVRVSDWNAATGRAKKDDKLNYHLDKLYDFMVEQKRELLRENLPQSLMVIKEKLLEKLGAPADDSMNLLRHFREFIDRIKEMPQDYCKGTVNIFRSTYKDVEEFVRKRVGTGARLTNVDHQFICAFDVYLKSRKPNLMASTIRSKHSKFRTVLYDAYRKGQIQRNPYLQFKLKSSKSYRTFLSQAEVDTLSNLELSNNSSLERVRDLFLFSIFTGLRFSDAQDLRKENLMVENGQHYLSKKIQKTERQFMLPLLKQAVSILEKYQYCRHIDGRLLPVISNQKFNKFIKYIVGMAGIEKNITHHVARHTFATTIALSNRVPIEIVQQWLGHSNIRETMEYAKVTAYHSQKYAAMLDEKFSGGQQIHSIR